MTPFVEEGTIQVRVIEVDDTFIAVRPVGADGANKW